MQICTLPGSLPVAPLCCFCRAQSLQYLICRMENPVPRLRCGHTFHIETCSPQKTVRPPFCTLTEVQPAMCTDKPTSTADRHICDIQVGGSSGVTTRGRTLPRSHGSCVAGLPSTSKTEAKNLHPATQLSGGLLNPVPTLSPPATATPAERSDHAHSPKSKGKTRVCLASLEAEDISSISTCLQWLLYFMSLGKLDGKVQ